MCTYLRDTTLGVTAAPAKSALLDLFATRPTVKQNAALMLDLNYQRLIVGTTVATPPSCRRFWLVMTHWPQAKRDMIGSVPAPIFGNMALNGHSIGPRTKTRGIRGKLEHLRFLAPT